MEDAQFGGALQRISPVARVVSVLYLGAVAAFIFLAFDFEGQINVNWTLALIVITLPASGISILFVWALIHGAGLQFFAVIYMGCAAINVLGANWLVGRKKRRNST